MKQGADIHADGDKAFLRAAEYGNIETVKCLIKNGANIHADSDYAFKWGLPKVIEYLKSLK